MGALFPQTILANPVAVLDDTTGTTPQTLVTGAAAGTKVFSVLAYNDDTVAHDVMLSIQNGSTVVNLGKISVPEGASAALLNVTDIPGLTSDRSFIVGNGVLLRVACVVLPAAGKTVQVTAEAAEYA